MHVCFITDPSVISDQHCSAERLWYITKLKM